jgi:carboxypeptidase T
MRRKLLAAGLLLAGWIAPATLSAAWHQVFIPVSHKSEIPQLAESLGGLDPCGTVITEAGIELAIEDQQLTGLTQAGFRPQILVADLEQHYAERLSVSRNYGAYHTYSEGMAEIQALSLDFPSIVGVPEVIGTTIEGNEIWAFKISDNPGVDEDEPEVFYNSYIHAREAITIEVLLHFVHYLTDNYGTDARVTSIVDERELWFVPFMNPDGVLYNEATNPSGGGMWRKNRRNNGDGSYGVDLNRNFGFAWGYDNVGSSPYGSNETYRGASAFSEPETQVIRNFVNSRDFSASITYHSYSNLLIYPWGYDEIYTPEPDHSAFVLMTNLMADYNGYSPGTAWELLYTTNGDSDDWLYGADTEHTRIMAITPEVGSSSDGFWPAESRIPQLVAENLEPNLIFAEMAGNPWSSLPPSAPTLAELGSVGGNYTVSWSTPSPDADNLAIAYELREMTGVASGSDSFDDTGNWVSGTAAFALSTTRYASAPTSFYGGTGNNRNAISELSEPISASSGMAVSFDVYYDIETSWDFAYVEASTDGLTWTTLAGNITTTSDPYGNNDGNGITGSSGSWVAASFPLDAYAGQSVLIRLRYETDTSVLGEGIYVDNFAPVSSFSSEVVLADDITDEFYPITGQSPGEYFYKVRAVDADGDWSGWSNLIQVISEGGEDLSGPLYSHTALPDTEDGSGPWLVQVTISDVSGVASASMDYRDNGGSWTNVAMSQAGSLWSATIPGPYSWGSLIEYRFNATDEAPAGNSSTSSLYDFQILVPGGIEYCQDFEGGLADFTVETLDAGGNSWTTADYTGQGTTAYIQYSASGQVDHSRLISPVFDCSMQGTLQLDFWHRLRLGYTGAVTDAYVKGSIDGGATWSYLLAEWHEDDQAGEFTVEGVESLDISSWAAGQSQVAICFEFYDIYDWYWNVDDVCLTGTLVIAPDPVVVSVEAQGSDMLLSWNASAGASQYTVLSSADPYTGFAVLTSTASTSYLHVDAASLGDQYYRVVASSVLRGTADPSSIPMIDPAHNRRVANPLIKVDR